MTDGVKSITSLSDLVPDERNANKGTVRGRSMVEYSLQQFGAGRSVLVDKNGKLIAGNKTTEAAASIGLDDVIVVKSDGKKVVVVQRTDLDLTRDEAAQKLAIADNRTSEVGLEWDNEVLAALLNENSGILDGMFDDTEIDALIESLNPLPEPGQGGDEFDTTPDETQTRVQRGDLWQLGRHRLLCSDSTNPDEVARLLQGEKPKLMVTDPPYGVEYNPEWRAEAGINNSKGMMGKVANDDRVDWAETYRLMDAQVAYVWHAGRHATEVARGLSTNSYDIIAQIIWAKDRFALSRGDYHWQHEPCWYAVKKGLPHNWQGARDQSTLWAIKRLSSNSDDSDEQVHGHGTQKPIECMMRPIENNTKKDELVVDPFLGSGTTLIAAERTGRRCYGIEIEPKYCDVILRRWEAETGQTAVKVETPYRTTPNA